MEVAEEAGDAVMAYALAAIADEGAGPGETAAALSALCDMLSLSGPEFIAAIPASPLAERLPRLAAAPAAGAADDGDVPLLAVRAMAEACEGAPLWAVRFAQHGAIEALRDRLLAVHCIELADECLRALDAISTECPNVCLSRGVAAAVLQFFDFFSTNKQKVALQIVSNIFIDYAEAYAPTAMEAVPALCNLLQSSDKTILESAISCLALAAAGASKNSEHMGKLCETNAVEATISLMGNEGWKSINDDTLTGILGLLKNLASVSAKAVKSLFELDFCELLKQMITYYSSFHLDSDKMQMLVELIYHLIPPLGASEQHAKLFTAKKNVIMGQSTYMNQLASIAILIVQVAKSAALTSLCYSCVVVISNIVELSTPDFLMELQKSVNLSSFLTCLLSRKNRHIVFQALKISRTLLEKRQHFFLETFTKEGVKYSIDSILSQEKNSSHQSKGNNNVKESCLCFDLESSSTGEACRIENNAVMKLAEEIKKSLFSVKGSKISPYRFGFALKSFRDFFARLNVHTATPSIKNPDSCKQLSDLSRRLLSDELPATSTFEFVHSGSVKHLAIYLSNGAYRNEDFSNGHEVLGQLNEVQSRLLKFASLALTMSNEGSANPLGILVEKLLDTLHLCYDSFPVMLSDEQRARESVMIPLRYTEEPTSLELKFRKSLREKELRNYNDVLSVNLFSTPDAIEPVLFSEVCRDQEPASKNSNQEKEANGSRKLGESKNAVLDGRILDIPLSKAFYKIMLEQELDIYDIPSFDPELGKTLIEFQALVSRKKFLETSSRTSSPTAFLSYRNMKLEDLCLDFTLPGSPEYELIPGGSQKMVTLDSLEEYVSLVVDATLKSGIAKQIEGFKSGVNEVFALKTFKMFTEKEMERILCGEQDAWALKNIEDHMEFEHGYDMSSPTIITVLEILREFGREEQRAFIQFTTGAPQLPLGGLASLDPKLTVVRKQCDGNIDDELPSVNTCRHFIKLPSYSSKEIMKKKLKYAITEGLGSFHLS
nr:unnamed protein product [Digitaria exilis]